MKIQAPSRPAPRRRSRSPRSSSTTRSRRGPGRAARGRRLSQRPDDEGGLGRRRSRGSSSATRGRASRRRVGADVRGVRPGDHVVLSYRARLAPSGACGHPPYCRDFRTLNGIGRDRTAPDHGPQRPAACTARSSGSRAWSHALAYESNVVVVGAEMEVVGGGCRLGCGVQTGAGTVLNVLARRRGRRWWIVVRRRRGRAVVR